MAKPLLQGCRALATAAVVAALAALSGSWRGRRPAITTEHTPAVVPQAGAGFPYVEWLATTRPLTQLGLRGAGTPAHADGALRRRDSAAAATAAAQDEGDAHRDGAASQRADQICPP